MADIPIKVSRCMPEISLPIWQPFRKLKAHVIEIIFRKNYMGAFCNHSFYFKILLFNFDNNITAVPMSL